MGPGLFGYGRWERRRRGSWQVVIDCGRRGRKCGLRISFHLNWFAENILLGNDEEIHMGMDPDYGLWAGDQDKMYPCPFNVISES